MATLTSIRREEARDAGAADPVARSPLADSYPCPSCQGDDFVVIGDVVRPYDCSECNCTGADETARLAAGIDDWLAGNGITVATHSERRLRELLITTAAGIDTWNERDEPGRSPLIAPLASREVEAFVEDMATEARDDAARYEPDDQYPFAFGVLTAMTKRLLHSVVIGGQSVQAVIRAARTGD